MENGLNKVRISDIEFENTRYGEYVVSLKKVRKNRASIDPYIIDLSAVKKEYLQALKNYIIDVETVIENWRKEPLPEFEIIASPGDENWSERVREELIIFEILVERYRTLYDRPPQFVNLRPVNENGTLFQCEYYDPLSNKYKKMKIKIPARYPYVRPVSSIDNFGKMCLSGSKGGLEGIWRGDGRFGIAHFLAYIIGPLIAILQAKNGR